MTESIIIRAALFLYAIFAFIAIYLIWKNVAAPDALKNTGIVFASIIPILIAALPYIISEKWSDEFHYILIYDSDEKQIVDGESPNAYESSYREMFLNLSLAPESLRANHFNDFMGAPGLDIIEKGILEAMMVRFMSHWDIVYSEWQGPTYMAFRGRKGSINNVQKISLNEIKSIFQHNPLISKKGIIAYSNLALPPESKLITAHSDKCRNISIENRFGKVTIEIRSSGGGAAQQGIWG